ncbi:MAG: xanthine dehydrogenase family protein molybdopterin-binding subunit [Acidobacteriota bacterium]|jgi:CO/xanthine dehydrogenase Mo-binding subunit|nr:xanthine dehydrogenase family protein molybdopterin-binding subunit [Acidobacteriota bacterium]
MKTLTPDARAALERAGFLRRDFLKGAGALIVGFSTGAIRTAHAQFGGPSPGSPPINQLDSWIAIAADGRVTAYSGKEELGQGISTAQAQLVAEELSVPFNRVNLIYCDTALTPDQAYTAGSQSHPANFNRNNLAQAGATAREALFRLASERLSVPVDQLTASDGVIRLKSDPSKALGYGQLVAGRRFNLQVDPNAKRKPTSEWTVLGKPVPRPDIPALVTGEFEFVHNVRVPGMLHGRVVRPPAVGATVMSVDEGSVKNLAGVVKVVVKKNFVGVVAEKPWQAIQAASQLKVTWSAGAGLPSHATFYAHMRTQPARDALAVDSKDVEQRLAAAATVLKATYLHPYQMHGSMGSSCAVADVEGEKATVWSPTQGVWYQKSTVAMLLGLKPENVHVIFRRGSGCYGLNGADTVTYDAAILSQAVGKPVRVQLSRKDEMAWENYGNAYVIDERAGLDAQGNIIAWDHESWSPTRGNRPGPGTPGNVVTGFLAGFSPQPFTPRSPASSPTAYNNNANAVPSYVAGNVGGRDQGTGTVKSERVLTHTIESPFWTGPLRSPNRLQNTFAHECFLDELAAHTKADPVEYRLRHLRDPRLIAVVNEVAKAANWEVRPSPKPATRKTGVVTGRGMASVLYEGDNGYSALVAEVEVNQDTGSVVVKRFVVCNDVGPVSNPDGLRNQIEGGALQGLSRALMEEVTWDDQKVTSFDWRTYHTLPLGFDVPKVEAVLLNRPDQEATGAGETSITVVAAALGNAIFDATGARIRQIPFTPERVKAALAARG